MPAVLFALAGTATAGEAPRLSELIHRAKIAGVGRVVAVEDLDYGRIRVHDLIIDKELKPGNREEAQTLRVVSLADEPGAAVVEPGRSGVAFVTPLRRNSYLDRNLPDSNSMYQFVDGRDGWLEAPGPDRLPAIATPVEHLIEESRRPAKDASVRRQNHRSIVFEMLSAPHPLLVENGIVGLSTIAGLAASLDGEEASILTSTLYDPALPTTLRERLIAEIAALDLRQMVGPLKDLQDPALRESAWAALRKLGAPVSAEDLRDQLDDAEPLVRLAATEELLARDPASAIPVVAGSTLRDRDQQVRLGAIEALGKTHSTAAIPPLESAFVGDSIEERQAAARALREIGGSPAADALHRLAFRGSIDAQRYAVVLLMTLDVGRDDPRVRDIVERHPDSQIQDMLEHGLEAGHGH